MMNEKNNGYLSMQQIFDKSAVGMLRQRAFSGDDEACLYRSDVGHKCAVGFLIDDKYYDPRCEGPSVIYEPRAGSTYREAHKILSESLKKSMVDIEDPDVANLLGDLQAIHDDHPVKSWHDKLMALAKDYNLSSKKIENLVCE